MTTKNDVTGDRLISKIPSDVYRNNWEKIFGNKYKHGRKESKK